MKKTILALTIALTSTSTFAQNYLSLNLGLGNSPLEAKKELSQIQGAKVEEEKLKSIGFDYTSYFAPLTDGVVLGVSLGGNYSMTKGSAELKPAKIDFTFSNSTAYLAPAISFMPVDGFDIYGKAGIAYNYVTLKADMSAPNTSITKEEKEGSVGWMAALGANYAFYNGMFIGAEYQTNKVTFGGESKNVNIAFLKIGYTH